MVHLNLGYRTINVPLPCYKCTMDPDIVVYPKTLNDLPPLSTDPVRKNGEYGRFTSGLLYHRRAMVQLWHSYGTAMARLWYVYGMITRILKGGQNLI